MATTSCRWSCGGAGVGLVGRLLDDDRPAERRDSRRDTQLAAAAVVVFVRHRRVAGRRAERCTSGWSCMLRDRATSAFLSGSPWAISAPSGATTSAKPCSPMRMRSTIRHISSRLNSPTSHPAGWLSRVRWMAKMLVGSSPRRCGSATSRRRRCGSGESAGIADLRRADAARGERPAALVEQRDLAEFAERQDVVLAESAPAATAAARCPAAPRRAP